MAAERAAVAAIIALAVTGCAVTPPVPAPADPVAAVRIAVDAINATAGGDVAVQQQVLRRLVDPNRTAEQDACAPATITVRIDPVLDRLTPAPATTTTSTPVPPTDRYRLPVLLEVYTGGIRTGTDLAGLDLTVTDGMAHLAPLCLR